MSQNIFQYKFLEIVSPLVCLQLLFFYITVSMIVLFFKYFIFTDL